MRIVRHWLTLRRFFYPCPFPEASGKGGIYSGIRSNLPRFTWNDKQVYMISA
jgi:hypothetical protein